MERLTKQITLKRNGRTLDQVNNYVNNLTKTHNVSYANLVITDTDFTFSTFSNISSKLSPISGIG